MDYIRVLIRWLASLGSKTLLSMRVYVLTKKNEKVKVFRTDISGVFDSWPRLFYDCLGNTI
jgi:hypothetical protein